MLWEVNHSGPAGSLHILTEYASCKVWPSSGPEPFLWLVTWHLSQSWQLQLGSPEPACSLGEGDQFPYCLLWNVLSLESWFPLWHHNPLGLSIASSLWDRVTLGQGALGQQNQHNHADIPAVCCAMSKERSCPDPRSLVFYFWQTWSFGKSNCLLASSMRVKFFLAKVFS